MSSAMVRAAVQVAPRQIELREFPRPQTGPDDGLLRVEANGICGSDVETYRGHLGGPRPAFIPGHEPLGIVEEVGERAAQRWGVQPGDRVALEVIVPCRSCHGLPDRPVPVLPQPEVRPRGDRHRHRAGAVGRAGRVHVPVAHLGAAQGR